MADAVSLAQQMFMECPLPASQAGQRGSEDNPYTSTGSQPLTWAGCRPGVPAWVSESQRDELRCVLVTLWGNFYSSSQILE